MGLFSKKADKNLGFVKLPAIIPTMKIKGNVAKSRFLNYEFTLPDGFTFTENSGKSYFNGTDYLEFMATDKDTTVVCYIAPYDSGNEVLGTWEQKRKELIELMISKGFDNPDYRTIKYTKFMGLDCYHYLGKLKGKDLYAEKFEFAAPFVFVNFLVFSSELNEAKFKRIFANFKYTGKGSEELL